MGEKDDYDSLVFTDSENSWISDGLPSSILYVRTRIVLQLSVVEWTHSHSTRISDVISCNPEKVSEIPFFFGNSTQY